MESNASDDEVIARILAGESHAYEVLFERYKRYVARILAKYLKADEIEDALLEVFARAYRKLESYDARAPFRFWLSTIAIRRAYDDLRKRKARKEVHEPELSPTHHEWMDEVMSDKSRQKFSADEEQRLASDVVVWALDQLTAEQRMIVTLVHFEERSYREVSELLGWSEVNVRVRALRARKTLKKIISAGGA